jgi:hypothetical protein
VLLFRMLALGSAASMLVVLAILFVATINNQGISWVARAVILAIVVASEGFVWYALRAPVLKATVREVACLAPLSRRRMPRTDLAFIFRGQAWSGGRAASWQPSYLFVAKDGKPGITTPSSFFTSDGITQLALRLQVPIRGDFSVQVKGRVDPAS